MNLRGICIKIVQTDFTPPPPFSSLSSPNRTLVHQSHSKFPKLQSLAYLNNNSYTNTVWHPTQMHRQSQMQMHGLFCPKQRTSFCVFSMAACLPCFGWSLVAPSGSCAQITEASSRVISIHRFAVTRGWMVRANSFGAKLSSAQQDRAPVVSF